MKKLFISIAFLIVLFSTNLTPAYAVQKLDDAFLPKGLPTLSGKIDEAPLDINEARVLLTQRIVNIVTGSAAIVATYFIINSGFMLVISGGNDDKLGPAKKGLTWAILGLLAILIAYPILSFIIKLALTAEDPEGRKAPSPQPTIEEGIDGNSQDFSGHA